ncbi:MAG: alpha-N-arabinofuranosidase [Candidatus Hydrogenedentes bacterium]|nr:alpha-N-arabinofuranosidase [Candidatus Hydrogenedentota bacterium]
MSEAAIHLWPGRPQARISPNLYGHFAEHLGRCVYEGIWVGPSSRVPHVDGARLDVIAALKQLRAPVLRWPGGCFANNYHWRQGVGPAEKRPETVNLWWRQTEPNAFGTDEFMRFCRAAGAEPYLCCNVGTGSPREALEWLEYCNFGGDSSLARLRGGRGAAPYSVRYWGIGNEAWGCGGRFSSADYAKEYVRFAGHMRASDPAIELVACGASFGNRENEALNAWNHDFCQDMRHADLIDHLSIHRYFSRGGGVLFSDAEYRGVFADLLTLERDLTLTEAVLRYFYPGKHVGIAVDEWGMRHPEATVENGLEQACTLRDAVVAGAVLNLLNRWAHRVTMANIAQMVNVLHCLAVTRDASLYLTPTYHVFDMTRRHMGASLVTHDVDAPSYDAHPVGFGNARSVSALSVSASVSGKRVHLSVANQTPDRDVETAIAVHEARLAGVAVRMLHAGDPRAVNTFDNPKQVVPRRVKVEPVKQELVFAFPRHSFTVFSLTLE